MAAVRWWICSKCARVSVSMVSAILTMAARFSCSARSRCSACSACRRCISTALSLNTATARAMSPNSSRRAAFELHATVGPAQATISAVAERAGVERHTVYRHFPDKASLLGAAIVRLNDAYWSDAHAMLERIDGLDRQLAAGIRHGRTAYDDPGALLMKLRVDEPEEGAEDGSGDDREGLPRHDQAQDRQRGVRDGSAQGQGDALREHAGDRGATVQRRHGHEV